VCAFALAGFLFGPLDPIFLQERAPEEMLGRVFGLGRAIATAGSPIRLALGGLLAEGAGLTATIAGMAALGAVALWALLIPALRGMGPPGGRRAAGRSQPEP
jgi:hypothetical protein